jgi:hypothetical protein
MIGPPTAITVGVMHTFGPDKVKNVLENAGCVVEKKLKDLLE